MAVAHFTRIFLINLAVPFYFPNQSNYWEKWRDDGKFQARSQVFS